MYQISEKLLMNISVTSNRGKDQANKVFWII